MKTLQPVLFIRNNSNSLFIRLIAGFLCIIVLFASLTLYSMSVSKESVRKEIVKYNTLMLENTKGNYENHFNLIKKQMLLFYYSNEVQNLHKSPSYRNFPLIVRDITTWVGNPYLFIENIAIYSKQNDIVLEKGTSTNAEDMFSKFYSSSEYPLAFWRQQFTETYSNRIFPSATMVNTIFRDQPQILGELIPIIFRDNDHPDFYMVVFLNAQKMYKAFHQSIYDDFIIYNDLGQAIVESPNQEPFLSYDELQTRGGVGEFVHDDKYYFMMKGDVTGYQYVYRVLVKRIASQYRLNITLIVAVVAAILLSILFSFLFTARINNPLKKVLESIRDMNENVPYRSNIKEFNIISNELHGNQMVRKQLSFIHHLKAIRSSDHDTVSLDFTDKPFVFILFQIKANNIDAITQPVFQKWLYYMKTFIDSKLKPAFPDLLTFQVEHDQILSYVFTEAMTDLDELLNQMKYVFDHDRDHGIVTIAISSIHSASNHLTKAYEEVQDLVGERLLINETQIIRKRAARQMAVGFSLDQDKEFEANLKEGNTAQLTALMERLYARWQGKEFTAAVLMRFAESMVGKLRNAVVPNFVESDRMEEILHDSDDRIQLCNTLRDLEQLLLEWVTQTAEAVREKKEEKYPITSFVIEYINEHLSEEIYLDVLAEKLKMSSGYLSSYFKGKTGKNIVDYINETRIAKAASLLADNRIKVHDAAKTVGYQNITSFNRMFKKYTGVTPSEYRKRLG
ncbi:hypothetical protein ASG89_05550 [Paenibacillus sp. Soil766]|uniref:helix-turn-helix domain-containing protein n=1 Tax=Paenibacillus sp. Soil766 TaxID=1736404 RepID=UPI00070F3007|nr:helix-turn-helix domain-containing protein [Paenibacillus sp. Soil766]KRE98466.1 hypothetical protein ASG89_05550 [Paenibacillus sp. Soil766]